MIIGALTIELSIDGAFSLKDKRSVLSSLRDKIGKKFNVSFAEIDDHELWNAACIAVVTVANDQKHVNRVLNKVIEHIEQHRDCVIEDVITEFI